MAHTPIAILLFLTTSMGLAAEKGPEEILQLLEQWQIEEALVQTEELLWNHPDEPSIWLLAAQVQHHRGEHLSALSFLQALKDQGEQVDPSLWQYVKAGAQIQTHATNLETTHFRLRYLNKDEIVARLAADMLEPMYQKMGKAFSFSPAEQGEKIVVEIFPSARFLAEATGLTIEEITTSGTVAVCKFHRIMITSPLAAANGYDWADTLAHEFVHLVVAKKSKNTIPIWLHEGLAKYYESVWKGQEGLDLNATSETLLAEALKKNKLISFAAMHPSMAKLPSQEDAALAFAEVFTVIQFFREKYGAAMIPQMLSDLAQGISLEQVFLNLFGMPMAQVEKNWKQWLRQQKLKVTPGLKPRRIVLTNQETLTPAETSLENINDQKVHNFARLGEMLQLRGHVEEAIIEYQKAKALAGRRYPTLSLQLARAYIAIQRQPEALKVLEELLEHDPDDTDAQVLAGRLYFLAGNFAQAQKHLEQVLYHNPFHPEVHQILASIYEHQGNAEKTKTERHDLELCQKMRPTRTYEVAPMAKKDAMVSLVARLWGTAKVSDHEQLAIPMWHYPVIKGSLSLEVINRRGIRKTATLEVQAGDNKVWRIAE